MNQSLQNNSKPKLSIWQIWNMSFGFLGIQFGFALQGGFMSRIFQTLGADKDNIPLLWIAAPLTGLLIQPIIGYMSDHTWHPKFGRRKPYFLIGAILSSIALIIVPNSPTLWVAAGLLWVLDASINISMEPFRALVADKLSENQRSNGFVIQTLIIGIGTWVASNLPWMVKKMGFEDQISAPGQVPEYVKIAFAIGAFVFLFSILYTIFTTKEYPPDDIDQFKQQKKETTFLSDLLESIKTMPSTMFKLGIIQFFSWFAFFTMWSMATPALTEHVFHAAAPSQKEYDMTNEILKTQFNEANQSYQKASDSVGSAMGIYGLSSMAFALLLSFYTQNKTINRRNIHFLSLFLGGIGFIMMYFVSPEHLKYCFVLIGLSWGSILSMPYAMLSSSVNPKKMGIMMGLFNMFIVIPQIVAAIGGVNLLYKAMGSATINAMILAGISLLIASFCNFLIKDKSAIIG